MTPSDKYTYHPSHEECKAIFVASCIEAAATASQMTEKEMYLRMMRVGLISDYILPCYEVLHAESRQNVTEDILKTLAIWENKKGVIL